MKKYLLYLAIAILCAATAGAQQIVPNPATSPIIPKAAKAPIAKALGNNQLYMAPYYTDELAVNGLGLTSYDEVLRAGTILPLNYVKNYEGGEVKVIRVGLWHGASDGAVLLWPVINLSPLTLGDPVIEQEVGEMHAGWNDITINEPYIISTEGTAGFMLGFQYRQLSNAGDASYPLSLVMAGDNLLQSFMYGDFNTGTPGWYDVGMANFGNLSVQAIVESENFADYDLRMRDLVVNDYAKVPDGLNFRVTLYNFGVKTLDNYVINALVDGQVVDNFDSPIELTPNEVTISATCSFEGVELTTGKHTFALQVAEIDGEPVENGTLLSGKFTAYHESFPRQKNVVEHFTSQYCTYCPSGEDFIKRVDQLLDGNLAWVSVHGNMSGTDIFHNIKSDQIMSYLGADSYPTATFNRFDYEKSGTLCFGINFGGNNQLYADYLCESYIGDNWTPVVANIQLEGTYDRATRELKLKVSGDVTPEQKTLFNNMLGVTVYLTEDGLIARQLNSGTWIENYTHNHVMRDMLSAVSGTAMGWNEDKTAYVNEFTTTLSEDWNADNMRVVAFVNRKGSGTKKEIFNCETLEVKDMPEPSQALVGDINGDGKVDIADVNAIINMMLGKVEAVPAADLNGDEKVDISDVNAVINLMLGKVTDNG